MARDYLLAHITRRHGLRGERFMSGDDTDKICHAICWRSWPLQMATHVALRLAYRGGDNRWSKGHKWK